MAVDDTVLSNGEKLALYDKGFDDGQNDAVACVAMQTNSGVILEGADGPVFLNGVQHKNRHYLSGYKAGFREKLGNADHPGAIMWMEAVVGLAEYERDGSVSESIKRVTESLRLAGESTAVAARRLASLSVSEGFGKKLIQSQADVLNQRAAQIRAEIRGEVKWK